MGDYKIDAGKFMAQIKEEKQEAAARSKQPSVRVNATTQKRATEGAEEKWFRRRNSEDKVEQILEVGRDRFLQ